MNLLSIDPGGTTGIAVKMSLAPYYMTSTATDAEIVWSVVSSVLWDYVIVERFSTAGRISKYGLLTVEIVGGIRALCHSLRLPIALCLPSHRYAFQEQASLYLKSTQHVIHETEALAHMFAWQYRNDSSFIDPRQASIN